MEKYEIQKLRDLPIEGVAERIGLRVARHKSLCPFHDDHHASLVYNTRRNTCRCFVCMKESMGTIDLVMRHLGLDFPKACQWLADANSIILTEWKPTPQPQAESQRSFDASRYGRLFEHPWLNGAARRFLFDERRIHPRVAAWCRLTSWTDRQGVNWLTTPYYDRQGNLIGVQNRNLDYSKKADVPRFRFPRGARCSIYNLPVVNRLKAGDKLFITEGCSDCWAMLSSGRKAIAIPSATLLSHEDRETLLSLSREKSVSFHMFPDCDAPGESLFMQLRDVLPGLVHHQLPVGCKDFGEAYSLEEKSQELRELRS